MSNYRIHFTWMVIKHNFHRFLNDWLNVREKE